MIILPLTTEAEMKNGVLIKKQKLCTSAEISGNR